MTESLRAMLAGAIDYAGLFPPAELSLAETAANYAGYLQSGDRWMLGRLTLPAARLSELDEFAEELFSAGKVRISAVGRGGNDLAELDAGLTEDLKAIRAFHKKHRDRAKVNMIELKIPPAVSPAALGVVVESLAAKKLQVFVEMSVLQIGEVHGAIHEAGTGGIKFRCGGVNADAFPSIDQLTMVIATSAAANLPLKFTAGLHHPLRRFDASVNTKMHGFINVYFAAIASHVLRLRAEPVSHILAIEDPEQFEFTDEAVRCGEYRVATQQIVEGRKVVTSFGSCSFDESREGLRSLGWL